MPDHLQKDFKALMNLAFDLKKKHPALKRNVKFDEEDGGMYLDFKLNEEADWKRVKPAQAAAANKKRNRAGVKSLNEGELRGLLSDDDEISE